MNTPQQIAKHIRDLHFGVNFTWSNIKDNLSDLSFEEATTEINGLNTIAKLAYHINYYVKANIKVVEKGVLDASDKLSFNHPIFKSQNDWDLFVEQILKDGNRFANLVEQLPEEKMSQIFIDEKYQDYFRNFVGVVEHAHYHLGQIAIIKKMLRSEMNK